MTRQIGFSAAAIIAAAILAGGCTQAPAPPQAKPKTTASEADDHGHAHDNDHHEHGAGPHGGTIADWGGGTYHVEFTVDHDKKEALVYLLGADMKTPAPVKTGDGTLLLTIREPSFQVELSALPLPGETDGKASCYGGTHEKLGVVREFAGTISGEVDGTPFAGDFAEEAHGDHDHK
jgi:hypothetical protein